MIRIICLGKIKEDYLLKMIEDYKKRIQKYHKIEIIELKDTNDLKEEGNKILEKISNKDFVISCSLEGKKFKSEELATLIDEKFIEYSNIVFIIGSSYGLDDDVKNRSNLLISFSDLTFPHGLFRGILLEQIYRAFKIINNETYHK